jgi:hypothetical protein
MKQFIVVILIVSLIGLTTWAAIAAVDAYALPSWSINSGGGESSGGQFRLYSAIGQPEAGSMSGGGYTLTGGFLGKSMQTSSQVFIPVVLRR